MDSYDQTTRFRYNPTQTTADFSAILEIFVHHARNIHNICIYENQDVYAKFSLTYNPDETFSTRVVNGGGKNPEFNEKIAIKIAQFDAVVKCEMWMLSRAKNYMEDQLLGFSLVPISLISGNRELTQEFSLSSTDLFHSPAGTVKLSLKLNTNLPFNPIHNSNSSITSEVVLLDRKISEAVLDPIEYSRIEFPDINVVKENQQMVSEYFGLNPNPSRSFLCLGAPVDDFEMVANSSEDNNGGSSVSPNENSCFFGSTMTSLSDDRNSAESSDSGNAEKGKETKGESSMQKEIVDMYMRSMKQFTESLGKMKLPVKVEGDDNGDVIQGGKKKKDGSRVFYGSRAFF